MRRLLRALLAVIAWTVKLGVFLLGAVAVAVLAAWWTVSRAFEASEVTVPVVTGMTVAEAEAELAGLELGVTVEARRSSETVEDGRIFFQEPSAGAPTRRGRHVRVVLSTGPSRIRVPDLAGRSPRAAVIALRSAGLELGDVLRVQAYRPEAGAVFAQDPPAGATLPEDGRVHVLVSTGRPQRAYVMPDLRGRPLDRVEIALASVGLRVAEIRQEAVPGWRGGLVHDQRPSPGSRVLTDTAVTLVISRQAESAARDPSRRPRLSVE